MSREIVIALDSESAEIFKEFGFQYPDVFFMLDKYDISFQDVVEFIVTITPPLLSALSAYLIARLQYVKGNEQDEMVLKKGDIEIKLKKRDINPDSILEMLEKLQDSYSEHM